MTSMNISNLASDVLRTFERTLQFFQNVGILQDYSFSHSGVYFSPTAEKYLGNFIAVLEEFKDILEKLQVLQKQPKPVEVNTTIQNTNTVPGDLISASHFTDAADIFVTEQLIPANDELGSFITPTELLNNDFIGPEVINEPATDSSWIPPEGKSGIEVKVNVNELPSIIKEKFQCSVCDKVLSSKTSLKFHQATHTGQKLFCCEHCGKMFTTNVNLSAHLTRQHNLNTEYAHCCSECGKLFVRKCALDIHMKCHLGIKPFTCNVCNKAFTQKVTRDTHQLTHIHDYVYCCTQCNKQFPTQAKLTFHSKTHGEPKFCCNLCDKKFATSQYLNVHYRTHDLRSPETAHCRLDTVSTQVVKNTAFSCGQCSRSFPSQHTLALHTQKHNPMSARYRYLEKRKMVSRQKYPCPVCGREFLIKSSLIHHHRQKHTIGLSESQQRPYSCELCHKSFTLRAKARLHMQIHTKQAQHRCELCDRMFLRKDSLQRHKSLHCGVAPVVCSICNHTSSSVAVHREHIKTHSAHYKCPQCEKTFKDKTALNYHIQCHEGKFKYQCNICHKQFVRKCHLNGHLLSHSTDRPFECDTCGKGFKDKKTCRDHIRRVHAAQIIPNPEQISANQMAPSQITANEMAASQMAIHTLLAGDDATYGQTYDQFQACVQLQ